MSRAVVLDDRVYGVGGGCACLLISTQPRYYRHGALRGQKPGESQIIGYVCDVRGVLPVPEADAKDATPPTGPEFAPSLYRRFAVLPDEAERMHKDVLDAVKAGRLTLADRQHATAEPADGVLLPDGTIAGRRADGDWW